jgi:hypothetical protein
LENPGFRDAFSVRAVEFVGEGSARVAAGYPYPTVNSKTRRHTTKPNRAHEAPRDITLRHDYLDVWSWCRVVAGSTQVHVITTAGAILVDEGFV